MVRRLDFHHVANGRERREWRIVQDVDPTIWNPRLGAHDLEPTTSETEEKIIFMEEGEDVAQPAGRRLDSLRESISSIWIYS